MRRLIACVVFLALAANISAQEMTSVTCPDGSSITPQMTISLPAQPPAKDDLPGSYFVSVITDQTVPTLAATDANGAVTCAAQDGLAEGVSVIEKHPGGEEYTYGLSSYSAWIGADASTDNSVSVGNGSGITSLIVEGGRITPKDGAGDLYTVSINPEALYGDVPPSRDIPLRVDVLGIDDSYTPGVSLVDDNGEVIQTAQEGPVTCTPTQCIGPVSQKSYSGILVPAYTAQEKDVAIWLPIAQQSTFNIRVENTNTEGAYTLIVYLSLETPQPKPISAQVIPNGDGSWTLRCDGQEAFTNGVKVSLDTTETSSISPETPLTLTALGADSPVTMAVMTSPTEGYCAPVSPTTSSYSLTLPDLATAPTLNSAQVTLDAPPAFVLIGSAQPSTLTLLVEGWKTPLRQTLVAEDNPSLAAILQALLTLDVPPTLINSGSDIRLYAIAADDLADAAVGVVNADGQPLTDANGEMACNDAGVPDQCPVGNTSLTGYTVTLGDGRVLPGASLDAMLHIDPAALPLKMDATLGADVAKLHVAAADRTGAGGSLIFVIGFALGQ